MRTMEKWTRKEAIHHSGTARGCFRHSYDHTKADPDNCSGCALRDTSDPMGPNYAGWARIYVEAGVLIPLIWKEAFEAELARGDNKPYLEALERSILTFGHPGYTESEAA